MITFVPSRDLRVDHGSMNLSLLVMVMVALLEHVRVMSLLVIVFR